MSVVRVLLLESADTEGIFAGKTGTSNEARDAWFVGYNNEVAVGAWLGYDDNSPIGLTGGRGAAPIVGEFMACASARLKNPMFEMPDDVVREKIDSSTGQVAVADCPSTHLIEEVYVRGTEPTRACSKHGGGTLPPRRQEVQKRRRERGLLETILGR